MRAFRAVSATGAHQPLARQRTECREAAQQERARERESLRHGENYWIRPRLLGAMIEKASDITTTGPLGA